MRLRSLLSYGFFYLAVVIAVTPSTIAWWYRVSFWLFAIFLFWVNLSFQDIDAPPSGRQQKILFFSVCFILVFVRIIPFLRWGEAPFGYDTGIYLRSFENYTVDYQEGLRPLGILVQIFASLGFSAKIILHGLLGYFNLLLGFSVYLLTKSMFKSGFIALFALFIFSVSISQYEAYIWMFYRMIVATVFLISALALLGRRSWLAIITGGFGGALHPATFLVFGFSYLIFTGGMLIGWLRHRVSSVYMRYLLLSGTAMLGIAIFINFGEFFNELPYLTKYKLQISQFPLQLSSELSGLYLNFTGFRLSTLFYLPFAFLGAATLLGRFFGAGKQEARRFVREIALPSSFVAVTLVLIIGKFVFYQRYLIILDLLIIPFAAYSVARLIGYFSSRLGGRVLTAIFFTGFSVLIVLYSWTREAWIPPQELRELQRVSARIEPGAYGMATDAYYTPWVYGYLTTRTVAPGYFLNQWSLQEWETFWYHGNDSDRRMLLARYGDAPIYVFIGSKQKRNAPMREFLDQEAARVSEYLWRYFKEEEIATQGSLSL